MQSSVYKAPRRSRSRCQQRLSFALSLPLSFFPISFFLSLIFPSSIALAFENCTIIIARLLVAIIDDKVVSRADCACKNFGDGRNIVHLLRLLVTRRNKLIHGAISRDKIDAVFNY